MTINKSGVSVRELALDVLIEVLEKGAYSHKTIRATLDKYQYLEKRDRAFLTRICEGTIEHVIELDYIINQYSKVKVKKMKPVIRSILRMGVYQIKYMDSVIDSAACNEAVNLAKKRGFKTLGGFVNGVLRTISRSVSEISYPDERKQPLEYLSITYSMPSWILELWMESYSYDTVKKICEGFLEERPLTIRVNLSKCSIEKMITLLEDADITVERSNILPYALRISNYNYMKRVPGFLEGYFQIQDESSMLIGEIAGVKQEDYVIDVCAAPGGKTLHIADKLGGSGLVDARDLTEEKVQLIEENVKRLDVKNVQVHVQDALELTEDTIEKADILIADLPCSGLGVMGKKTDIKYKMTKEQQEELVELQKSILAVVTKYVKPGKTMIYSTCTINPSENEKMMQFIIDQYGFELQSIDEFLPKELQGDTTKKGYLQLLPGVHHTDGFFMAKLKKC